VPYDARGPAQGRLQAGTASPSGIAGRTRPEQGQTLKPRLTCAATHRDAADGPCPCRRPPRCAAPLGDETCSADAPTVKRTAGNASRDARPQEAARLSCPPGHTHSNWPPLMAPLPSAGDSIWWARVCAHLIAYEGRRRCVLGSGAASEADSPNQPDGSLRWADPRTRDQNRRNLRTSARTRLALCLENTFGPVKFFRAWTYLRAQRNAAGAGAAELAHPLDAVPLPPVFSTPKPVALTHKQWWRRPA